MTLKKSKIKARKSVKKTALGPSRPKAAPKPAAPVPAETESINPKNEDFYIVGLGASAGGLEAFEQFFSHMPADSGMAFVLVTHLSPEHKSLMAELLRRYSAMDIAEVSEGMEVRPNRVYVIPPNRDLVISNNVLLLHEPAVQHGVRHPIDLFLRSLAQDRGDRAICVILSGTGTEGALGLRDIKGAGGLVLAQDVQDAKYDGMPSSAIATGLVDHVLPAAKMPEVLIRYTKAVSGRSPLPPERSESRPVEGLQRIHVLLRAQTGHDFALYKQNTVLRRINKRMAIHQIEALDDYIMYLRNNPHEIDVLFSELLIRVTNFFRDPEAYDVLKERVLPLIFNNKHPDGTLRLWVPGCSTGEEAYSLAILCHEYLREHKGPQRQVQIFATDIDTGAIEIARGGVYPESIAEDVSPERLSRFFVKRSGSYKIKDEVRESVVFAVQDLIKDPPFSRLDFVSCRNVLIYLGAALQRRVLSIFHYALNPGGVLFLGSSETVGEASDLFSAMDKRWKLYTCRHGEVLPAAETDFRRPAVSTGRTNPAAAPTFVLSPSASIGDVTERLLMDHYSPPCAVVNDKGDILYIHGKTGKYLEPAAGKASLNIVEMARDGIRFEIRAGLRKVLSGRKDVAYKGLQVKMNGGYKSVDLEIKYVTRPEHLEGLVMIVFRDAAPQPGEKKTGSSARLRDKSAERLSAMEYELKSTREHLQTTIEEMETSNEELKSANEELQSSNEELQSTNEELVTSREELQSVNEELLTVNTELQHKIEELSESNNDIVNLLASTEIATIFLTPDLRIRRFTPSAGEVINIIQTDVGRPLSDLTLKLDYPEIAADAEKVLRNLSVRERTVRRQDDRWFLVRIIPYRTVENVIDGAVLTFQDMTAQKKAQELKEGLIDFMNGIVDTVREPLLVLDHDLRVVSANRSFYETFRTAPDETDRRLIYELGNGQWEIPALKALLNDLLSSNQPFADYLVELEFPSIGRKKMLLNARRIYHGEVETETILLAMEDVTEKGSGR